MIWILATFAIGMFLSAFFSGCETGFYRATRFRFAIDGLSGDPISRRLLWLTNNPTLFVATTLIGNNLANYLTSRAVVQANHLLFDNGQMAWDVLVPLLVSPFIFVYGELLPKNIFLLAPNKLLRTGGPLFLVCGVLFAPVSAILWFLGRVLERLLGESPAILRSRLARAELQKVIDEGHEIGILHASQRTLSHAVLEVANDTIGRYCGVPLRMPSVRSSYSRAELLRLANRNHTNLLLLVGDSPREVLGYVRIIDVHLTNDDWQTVIRPIIQANQTDSLLKTLLRLQSEQEPLAQVVDSQGRNVGIVDAEELLQALFGQRD